MVEILEKTFFKTQQRLSFWISKGGLSSCYCLPYLSLAGVLAYEISGHTVDDMWESTSKNITVLVCFYWMILEKAHHIAGLDPWII